MMVIQASGHDEGCVESLMECGSMGVWERESVKQGEFLPMVEPSMCLSTDF